MLNRFEGRRLTRGHGFIQNTAIHRPRRFHAQDPEHSWNDIDVPAGQFVDMTFLEIGSCSYQRIMQVKTAERGVRAKAASTLDRRDHSRYPVLVSLRCPA